VDVKFRGAGDLKRLNRQLRDVADGKALRKELTGGLRDVLRPVATRVKAAYLASPSGRGGARRKGGSLRRNLARVTRVEVRTSGRMAGARVRVDGRKMPTGAKALPAYREGYRRPWRHPVYGNTDVWVTQPAVPVFDRTVEPYEQFAGRAVDRVLDDVRDKLERGR
jgi:hypothetical protein